MSLIIRHDDVDYDDRFDAILAEWDAQADPAEEDFVGDDILADEEARSYANSYLCEFCDERVDDDSVYHNCPYWDYEDDHDDPLNVAEEWDDSPTYEDPVNVGWQKIELAPEQKWQGTFDFEYNATASDGWPQTNTNPRRTQ